MLYATSIDYDGQSETSQDFFAQVQNKMHWAAHGHTATEVIRRQPPHGPHPLRQQGTPPLRDRHGKELPP
ncbi:MAG: RhuM family protein [Verrucomicrobiota bacterium]